LALTVWTRESFAEDHELAIKAMREVDEKLGRFPKKHV
jgi:hypothetical protein